MANNKLNNENTVKFLDEQAYKVYQDNIYALVDDYIDTLCINDRNKVNEDSYMDSSTFTGLILYISDHNVKPNNDDIELLDNVFNIYYRLCNKYKQLPTLELFAQMVSICNGTLSDWASGQYRLGSSHGETVKRWRNICKSSLVNSLSNSKGANINQIFIAKAAYGMVETAPVQMINQEQRRSAEQIAADYTQVIEQKDVIDPDF